MEKETQTEELSLETVVKDLYSKIDTMQAVIGYLLEKVKLLEKDAEGSVLDPQ